MADEAMDDISKSAGESREMLRDIADHHQAAEDHADRAIELGESPSALDNLQAIREEFTADLENEAANAIADELQAKVGPNHTVNTDGTLDLNKLAPGASGLDMDRARLEDRLAGSTGASPEELALAGPGATESAEEALLEQEAAEVARAGKAYVDSVLKDAGLDPSTATKAEIEGALLKEQYRQSGLLDLIEDHGGDPGKMSLAELEKAAKEAVAAKEEELGAEKGGLPDDPQPPDDGAFDGPIPDRDKSHNNDDEDAQDLVGGNKGGPEPPPGGKDGPDADGGGGGGGGGGPKPGEGQGGGSRGGGPSGGDPVDDTESSTGGIAAEPAQTGQTEPGPPEEPSGDSEVVLPGDELSEFDDLEEPVAGGKFPLTDGNEAEGTMYKHADGEYHLETTEGESYGVTEAYSEGLDELVDEPSGSDEPIEQFVAPNRHVDDPTIGQMIQQEHDAKANADIDYGDQDEMHLDTGYDDIRPDQIDYGIDGAPPSDDPDIDIESPDAGVIDPSDQDAAGSSGSRSGDDPLDQLAIDRAGDDREASDGDDTGDPWMEDESTVFGLAEDEPLFDTDLAGQDAALDEPDDLIPLD